MTTSEGPARPARRREGYDAARTAMIQLAHGFAGLAPTERTAPWAAFDAFILGLANQGWKRGDIYHLLVDVENNEASQLAEESRDALYDYETGLIGHVSHDSIVRLPGEPTDQPEFLRYVYGETWMHEP
jgi:hypothetical protein